jgi:2-amino-4-hydroxy-6-hydroxymethyldihydropteridine diphosphokinase
MPADTTAFVAFGSNLGDRLAHLEFARARIGAAPRTRLVRASPLYRSTAIGPGRQPDYLNAVLELHTGLEPLALLDCLQSIEQAAGRTRTLRWGARTLDLDLLLHGAGTVSDARITLPHRRLAERNFVVYPLFDLAPDLILPCGTPLARLRNELPGDGLWRLEDSPESTRASA